MLKYVFWCTGIAKRVKSHSQVARMLQASWGRSGAQPGGGTIVSVRPRQVAVLCLERAQAAPLNRMEKYDGSKSSCSLLPCRSASSG